METSAKNYLVTVRLMADQVKELPIASYWIDGNQELVFLNWMEKLSARMEFSAPNWSEQLKFQLERINDFFRAKAKVAEGDFPFSSNQLESIQVYRFEKQNPQWLSGFPVKSILFY